MEGTDQSASNLPGGCFDALSYSGSSNQCNCRYLSSMYGVFCLRLSANYLFDMYKYVAASYLTGAIVNTHLRIFLEKLPTGRLPIIAGMLGYYREETLQGKGLDA